LIKEFLPHKNNEHSMNPITLMIRAVAAQKLAFRRHTATKFDDPRISTAIALLENILQTPDDAPTSALDNLSSFECRRAVQDTLHRLGFRVFVTDWDDLITAIADTARSQRREIDAIWRAGVATRSK
jgi:hypothetical protein